MARGTWVAAFLARKLGSLITWRFSTAKFPASRLEMLNRGILLLSVLKVLVWIFVLFMEKKVAKRKSLPFQHSAVTQGTTAKVHLPLFSSQYPIIRILLGQWTPGCYLTNIRSSFFGWVYCFSRLIASRLELRASISRFVNCLYLLCYVSRTFCSALSWFCWQTTCKTYCYAQYGERKEKQSTGHSFSSTSCYWNH